MRGDAVGKKVGTGPRATKKDDGDIGRGLEERARELIDKLIRVAECIRMCTRETFGQLYIDRYVHEAL